jgi:hypothetical protein
MKLFAMLKDSLREAVDRKIFAAMLVLSGLLTLFVASISYRPIALEDDLQAVARAMTWGMSFNPHLGKLEFRVENFRQTNDAREPWRGDYEFDWVGEAEDLSKLPPGLPTTQKEMRRFMKEFHYLEQVEVSSNKSKEPKQFRFTITTHGTTVDDALGWRYEPRILFSIPLSWFHMSVREAVYVIEDKLVNGVGAWVAVLIGVIVTASFIPSMLEKGAIELWLAKPLRRTGLLINKYLGGLIFMLVLTTVTVLSVWVVIGLRSGIWTTGFFVVIPAVTLYFALLYSVSTLTAVLTRSTVVAILVTLFAGVVLFANGWAHGKLAEFRQERTKALQSVRDAVGRPAPADADDESVGSAPAGDWPQWVYQVSDISYKGLPRTREMDDLTTAWVGRGLLTEADQKRREKTDRPPWWETLGVNAAFIGVMLGLACWKFSRTDY